MCGCVGMRVYNVDVVSVADYSWCSRCRVCTLRVYNVGGWMWRVAVVMVGNM